MAIQRLGSVILFLLSLYTLGYVATQAALPPAASAQAPVWYDVAEGSFSATGPRDIIPAHYRLVGLNLDALQAQLVAAPLEFTAEAQQSQVVLALPLPDGGYSRFRIVESPIMAPKLAAQFPEIKSYAGQGIDDPTATTRFDWTPNGFHAIFFLLGGTVYIDPYSRNDTVHYISYYTRDFVPAAGESFFEPPPAAGDAARAAGIASLVAHNPHTAVGDQLRTYRLALAATGEYTQFYSGTVAAAMGGILTTINRVNAIVESLAWV